MSGEDGGLFIAERRGTVLDGEEVDLGLVGDVVAVNTEAIEGLDRRPAGYPSWPASRPTWTAWCTT